MTINIGIDVGKNKCVATIKSDTNRVLERVKFENRTDGIMELVELAAKYSRRKRSQSWNQRENTG